MPRSLVLLVVTCVVVLAMEPGITRTLAFSTPTPTTTKSSTTSATGRTPNTMFAKHFPSSKVADLLPNEVLLTYLEINGFLLTFGGDGDGGVTVLIDPILDGPLDFGIPDLYCAQKKTLPSTGLAEQLPPIDCLLLTQGLEDHAHVRTLTQLAQSGQLLDVTILAPQSARPALEASGLYNGKNKLNVGFLKHGDKWTVPSKQKDGNGLTIQATKGALVGPPWQTRENGYILRPSSTTTSTTSAGPSVYIEPHVDFDATELQEQGPVDIVISPIEGQRIASVFDLVFGSEKTVELVETLRPKVLVPMTNGNIDASGPVSGIVSTNGSEEEFLKRLAASRAAGTRIQNVKAGEDHIIRID